jgi:hypothetical protein
MKKALLAVLVATSFAASAADFVSVDVDHVTDRVTNQKSLAEYVRAGKELAGVQLGLQSRTARYADGSGMFNSLELTAGKNIGNFTPYVGYGWDNAKNGQPGQQFGYGLVGGQYGMKVGPGFALAGVKTRLRESAGDPKQTVSYATYSIPVVSKVAVNLNLSRSDQDIKERALGLGVSVGF